MNTMPGITATGAGLLLPFPSTEVPYRFTLEAPHTDLMWETDTGGGTQLIMYDYSANIDGGWLGFFGGGAGWQFASASPVAVPVAVPEPSSLYLVGFGAVCVYVMGHKRKARRTATTDV